MTTIHLLTLNNAQTVHKAIQSITPCNTSILIGDLGSSDDTVAICRSLGHQPLILENYDRLQARQHLSQYSKTDWNMYIEPWEALTQGHQSLKTPNYSYSKVVQNNFLSQEIRFWRKGDRFVNKIFEKIDKHSKIGNDLVFFSVGRSDYEHLLTCVEKWKKEDPLTPAPYYYHALILFIQQKYEEFRKITEYYLHSTPNDRNMARTMLLYYYALVFLLHYKEVRPALQSLNLCLSENPLMAEFWCLTGDVHYHLRNDMIKARSLYENAKILGKFRSLDDRWPMDISKYQHYPDKMMENCQQIINCSKVITNLQPQAH